MMASSSSATHSPEVEQVEQDQVESQYSASFGAERESLMSQSQEEQPNASYSSSSQDPQTTFQQHLSPPNSEQSLSTFSKPSSSSSHNPPETAQDERMTCWICFQDNTEDTPNSSPWCSPCPCALRAHEGCLIKWATNPQTLKQAFGKLQCPQCKEPIHFVTPRLPLVGIYETLAKLGFSAQIAGYYLLKVYRLYATLFMYNNMGIVPLLENPENAPIPLLPLSLVANTIPELRKYTPLAVLPPAIYHIYQNPESALHWPPDDHCLVYSVPWVQFFLRTFWSHLIEPLENRLARQVNEAYDSEVDVEQRSDEAEMTEEVELRLEVGGGEQGNPENTDDQQPERAQQPATAQAEPGDEQPNQPATAAAQPPRRERGFNLTINPINMSTAFWFPILAGATGHALKHVLPTVWTTVPRGLNRPTGLLQTSIGRLITAGTLLVLTRETIRLSAKYQFAHSRKHWKVLNYTPPRDRPSAL